MERITVARWESKSGRHWVELYRDQWGYGYTAPRCGGNLGSISGDVALAEMERRVADGYFQPDANITPMKRIA